MKAWVFTAFLILSASGQSLEAQNTPWDIIYCLNGGENKSVGISKLTTPNPVAKPGWNLIFSDEFQSDSLDAGKWNRGTPFDDGNGTCNRGFAVNPGNILVEDGHARILNTVDPQLPDCPYSYGEIKTMSVRDTGFRSYYFYAPGYLETRVKLFTKTGQGAACWLWGIGTPENPGTSGPWNEIDVFELNGVNSNIFNGAYHWTYNGQHVSQHHAIYLTDSSQQYDLATNWTTFGLEWDSTFIRWYVNNVVVKELDLTRIPPYCVEAAHYLPPATPFCLRLNSGNNSVGNQSGIPNPADFPQSMLVDYVRIYKKAGSRAAPIVIPDGVPQICASAQSPATSGKIITTHYYPDAVQLWNSPAFEMQPVPPVIPQPPGKMVVWIKPATPPGQSYPVYSETIFPGNYSEKDTAFIFISADAPILPAGNFVASQVDSACRFALHTPSVGDIAGCDFSLDSGLTWHAGTMLHEGGITTCTFGAFKPEQPVNFSFREQNGCGYSPIGHYSIVMPLPPPGCQWPAGTGDDTRQQDNSIRVSVTPNPFTAQLNIRLMQKVEPIHPELQVNIYDVWGRNVACEALAAQELTLDLSRLGHGTYFLLVTTKEGIIFRSKILKR